MNILITGINGFVGRALAEFLLAEGHNVAGTVRSARNSEDLDKAGVKIFESGEIDADTDWSKALDGIDAVVHLAARVHVMNDSVADPLTVYRTVNTYGTEALARQAVKAGVRRFVYLSTVKVNGEERETPYTEDDLPRPQDAYGISKFESEQHLKDIAGQTGLEVVIIRPPLVYGPGVRANFLRMLSVVAKSYPLPFGSLNNKRSMIFIANLTSAIARCLTHAGAVGNIFLVSDGEDLSVREVLMLIAAKMGVKLILVPVPRIILNLMARIAGKSAEGQRLINSLCVKNKKIRDCLGWSPPFSVEEGIARTVQWFERS